MIGSFIFENIFYLKIYKIIFKKKNIFNINILKRFKIIKKINFKLQKFSKFNQLLFEIQCQTGTMTCTLDSSVDRDR